MNIENPPEDIKNLVERFKNKSPTSNFKRWERPLYDKLVEITNFLPNDVKLTQRLWHVKHQTEKRPLCIQCKQKTTSWNYKTRSYRDFCSSKCSMNNTRVKNKVKQTIKHNHGVEYYTQSKLFNEKRKATYLKNYGYEWSLQSPEVREQIYETCVNKYGSRKYTQSDDYKQKTKKSVNQNYNIDYISQNIPVTKHYSPYWEIELINFLKENDIKFIHNSRKIIYPKELDIYLPDYNLAIELCGLYWHSDIHSRMTPDYHKIKTDLCNQKSIQLLTIFEDEWKNKPLIIKERILNLINKSYRKTIYARKTEIKEIDTKKKQQFLNDYHIQGDGPSSINYGLFYDNQLIAVLSMIKQRNGKYILNRYATSVNVPGGFSKLLTYFKRNHQWEQIITFADLRWSNGDLYEKCGFVLDNILKPDYFYIVNNKRFHKFQFRHKFLKNKLKHYDPMLTEKQNCDNNGILRIWDCGKKRYVINNEKECKWN